MYTRMHAYFFVALYKGFSIIRLHNHHTRLAPSCLFERRSQTNKRRSREETTCLACMNSNLICILLAGNYCHDVMDM